MLENTNLTFASSFAGQQSTAGKFGVLWCDLMHDAPMWPIHGRYICSRCLRQHPVAWDRPIRSEIGPASRIPRARYVSLVDANRFQQRGRLTQE